MKTTFTHTLPVKVFLVIGTLLLLHQKGLAQDDCASATNLNVNATCSSTSADLKNMTPSGSAPAGCGDPNSADIWFSFVADNPWPVITFDNMGNNLKTAGPVIQLLSGTCGSLTTLSCISGASGTGKLVMPVASAVNGSGLTVGNTYYIRILTNTNTGTVTGGGWNFTICVADPKAPSVDYGKSYVNISKGNNGGTVEPGDTLEVRATFVVSAGATIHTSFTDNIPAGTTYVGNTLRILTNEGKIYKQFTDAADGDPATITGSSVTINMGDGATQTDGGYITNTNKPNFYGSTCIMVASYRVVVNAAYSSQINIGGGYILYNNGSGNTSANFPYYLIMVFKNYGLCANSVGTNAIISEAGGTFGSGNIKDRTASTKVPPNYTYAAFSSSGGKPNDYYYCVSNNTSGGTTPATGYAISNTAWPLPDPTGSPGNHRIFGVWDIIGDHTGASNPVLGNPPTDDLNGASGGYMVVINAAYRTDTAFLDTVYNLCPNTYYQYTAWFRNICSRCGCDSSGVGASGGGYIPTAPGDSSGVYPNLTFNVNGYDYYTTGNMLHTGEWVQKGFTYLTGPTETSMVISIRNNAPGGGGNDWAIDDIGVASCVPNMVLTPNKPDLLCQGADDTVRFKVTAFFPNYTEWKLEQSTDNGVSWTSPGTDTTGKASSGSATPVYNASTNLYEYLVTRYYRLNLVDTLIKYRIIVGSTPGNLNDPNCSFITLQPKTVRAANCWIVLPTQLLNFKGQSKNGYGVLQWTSTGETDELQYVIEAGNDGISFSPIGSVHGQAPQGMGTNYQFTDPTPLAGARYYRIKIMSGSYSTYSRRVMLSDGSIQFSIRSLGNPFIDHIGMELVSPTENTIRIHLIDMYGRVVKTQQQVVMQGLNNFDMPGLGGLPNGTYVLQVAVDDKIFSQKMVKMAIK